VLANPIHIVIGPWDKDLALLAVLLALVVECAVIARMLRDDVRVPWRAALLGAINLVTWPLFATALPSVWRLMPPGPSCLLLEGAVVLVEGSLLWAAGRTRWRTQIVAAKRLSWARTLAVAFWGNLASVLAGYLFLALVLKPNGPAIVIALTAAILFVLSEFVQDLAAQPRERSPRPHRSSGPPRR